MITIFHGSNKVREAPEYGKGRPYNDYGVGFYLTRNKGLAGEWAVLATQKDGYINEYIFDDSGLETLSLDSEDIKYWIAILMDNRRGNYEDPLTYRTIEAFKRKYLPDISACDIITGWRADDSYFSYVEAFAAGNLSLENLQKAMRFGNLGQQVCLKSREAFNPERLKFVVAHKAEMNRFFQLAYDRDREARKNYVDLVKSEDVCVGTLIRELI